MPRTYEQQPNIKPGTPPTGPAGASSAQPITYGDLRCSIVLGRGIVVEAAAEHTKIAVAVLTSSPLGIRHPYGDRIRIAEQVEYEITGYDPSDCTLTLHLVHDWRPGQKDDPNAEQPDHQD